MRGNVDKYVENVEKWVSSVKKYKTQVSYVKMSGDNNVEKYRKRQKMQENFYFWCAVDKVEEDTLY